MGKELQRHSAPKMLSVTANMIKLLNCCTVESQFSIYELATSRAPSDNNCYIRLNLSQHAQVQHHCANCSSNRKTKTNIVLVSSIKHNRWSNLARLHKK